MWLIKKDKEVAGPAADEKSADHLEDQPPLAPTLSRNQRLRHHLIRFWIWYTVGSVVFLAIFLPIFFKICIPAISQRVVDDTPLSVNKAQLLDPTPETLTVSLDTTLDIPLKATTINTDPFSLGLFNRATKPMQPYLDLSLPTYKLRGTSNMQISNKDCQVASQEELIRVLSNALHSKEFKLSALGSTMAHLGALNAHITLDKNINLVGLDDLRGWGIETIGILSQPEEDGTNVRGTVNLPNHSVVEFALGNVTFNLHSGNLNIGLVHVDNAFLASGDNSFPIYGHLNLTTVLDNFRDIFAAQKEYISSGDLLLSVNGNTVVYNGQHLPYYEEVFQNANLSTQLPVSRILKGTLNGIQDNGQGGIQGLLKQLNLNLTSLSGLSDLPGMSGLSSLGNNS